MQVALYTILITSVSSKEPVLNGLDT
ncbi:UNVERIFIED_CONTAM: hypothetical protein GTU68_012333 [Idotea baltica]|nr:hypothetical protein [Idotea baltica]